jgi:hypothetical protein
MAENRRPVRVLAHRHFADYEKSADFLQFSIAVSLHLGLG